jgi:hypothetical protein
MSLHSTLPTIWLLGLGLLIVPPAASGQAPASDTTAQSTPDSQPTLTDSVQRTFRVASDTGPQRAHPDSGTGADSTRAATDTVRPKAPGTGTTSGTTAARPEPVDSILSAACRGTGSTAVARDLLVIVFAPESSAAERAAVARTVDGTLLGSVTSGEPGAYYLRVPSGGNEYRLRVAADSLILLDMVRQVGSRTCPPLPPP